MNRFSQDNWHNGTITKANYDNFISNCHQLVEFFGKQPNSFILGLDKLIDPEKGLNYVAWNHKLDGDAVEISYSLIHTKEDSYAAISISKGDFNEAGIDQELKVTENPVPHLKRLMDEWSSDHTDATELHMPIEDGIIKRIDQLTPQSPSDEKIDTWKAIQTVEDQAKKNQLEHIFKDKISARKINRLVRKSWNAKKEGITSDYVVNLIDETLANIEMAFHDPDGSMLEEFDNHLGNLCVGALDYAVARMGADGFTETLPKEIEAPLYQAVKKVGDKYNDDANFDLSDEMFAKLSNELALAIKKVLLHGIHDEEDESEPAPHDSLLKEISQLTPHSDSNDIIDTYNKIKALPDSSDKQMLINKLKENTKKAFNKLMNRFSKERWAQSRTVGDPPWIGNPDYGKPKFNPDEARYELDQACRKKAGDITERFIEEIWMELGIDTSDVPYKEPNGLQIEMKACEKWGQSWWDNYGEKLLDDWISRNTDSDTHFNEDDAEEVFSNENIGREMLESFAPAYALLLSKITNLSKDILERIKNYK